MMLTPGHRSLRITGVVLCAALGACSRSTEIPMPRPSVDVELEQQLVALQTPFGDGANAQLHQRALTWLVSHPEQAEPRLLALLAGGATNLPAVMDALARLGKPESVGALARLVESSSEHVAWEAAQALARHPAPTAREALETAVRSPRRETAVAAADALLARGDREACAALKGVLGASDTSVRYHAVQAALALGCLTDADLTDLARDPQLRDLVSGQQ